MRKIIYIAGLSHSGTTLLDLLLGAHPHIVGVGEAGRLLMDEAPKLQTPDETDCCCGVKIRTCPFWGGVQDQLSSQRDADLPSKYSLVYNVFDEVFGDEVIAVDSSKDLRYLKMLADRPDTSIYVLHLLRDVRAYAISRVNARQRKSRPLSSLHAFHFFRKWYAGNRAIDAYLAASSLPALRISYDGLCTNTERVMKSICDMVCVDFDERMLSMAASSSHIVAGNRMSMNHKQLDIRLDDAWKERPEWSMPSLLFPRIMAYNDQHVVRASQK